MKSYIHYFKTEQEYNDKRTNDYYEPWVAYTKGNTCISYNKSEYQKLLETPLTFEILSDGEIKWTAQNSSYTCTIEYNKNNGQWISITSNTGTSSPSINVVSGDVIRFRGNNATYSSDSSKYNNFSGTTAGFTVKGNIMSLINNNSFMNASTLTSSYTFYNLFSNCIGLTDASKLILPATTLSNNCYGNMFYHCTSLTSAPELPAITLTSSCYYNMFNGCTSLTIAPELPATTLTDSCYMYMFSECRSLVVAPELPATTLANGCYFQMFANCTSLTSAPTILPATTLAALCYAYMFAGCSSLTTAPELPATTLVDSCYWFMFALCTNLNYIKCLATDISANQCTSPWVWNVSSTGTFVKAPSMTDWTTGNDGIPSGWTVQDA